VNRLAAAASIVLVAGLATAAGADVLVTRDGATVETKGPWSVEGRRVIFTQPNGTLSSLPTAELDLDHSAVATARAADAAARAVEPEAQSAAAPLAPPPPPVLRITDQDLAPATPAAEESGAEANVDQESVTEAGPESGGASPLQVISWDRVDLTEGEGVEIFGTIRNNGTTMVAAPSVSVLVYGERGGLLATSDGTVNLPSIPPGKTANFRAPLPGLYDFAAIKFDVGGRGYRDRGSRTDSGPAGETKEEAPVAEEEVDVDPGAKYDEMAERLYEESYEEPVAEDEGVEDEPPLDEEPPPLD
jgi:hypothetical protein